MQNKEKRRCLPCEGGIPALNLSEAEKLLGKLDAWDLSKDGKELIKHFHFANFYETMAFVNAIAWMAHQEDHHPDLQVSYNHIVVRYTTHAVGGLTENDFICAERIDQL